jgi:hypothetical protein
MVPTDPIVVGRNSHVGIRTDDITAFCTSEYQTVMTMFQFRDNVPDDDVHVISKLHLFAHKAGNRIFKVIVSKDEGGVASRAEDSLKWRWTGCSIGRSEFLEWSDDP